jgi:triacylglycerol lipase
MLHRLYFSPGMFGFGRLASYDYFGHLERALSERLRAAGEQVETYVAELSPTASIRRRGMMLAQLVASTCDSGAPNAGPIHLVGHSTGGLDARLLASPSVSLGVPPQALAWRSRLASITTINAPHFGTPLASFFTTVSGERVLRALSALTIIALTVGSPSLSAVSALVAAFGRVDRLLGLEVKVLDRATESLLRGLDDARSHEVRGYLDAIKGDAGAMVQLMPEAMDLFAAGIEDRPGVLYQSTASMAPLPALSPRAVVGTLLHPMSALSSTIFAILYGITSRYDERYPCADPRAAEDNEQMLARAFGRVPGPRANDGVVPIHSQIWGKVVWVGYGDHLDVIGHFRDDPSARKQEVTSGVPPHVDWLRSGSDFDRARFGALVDAVAAGMLSSVR